MAETDLAEGMVAEEARLVHIAVYADDAALSSVLPHSDVATVGQHGLLILVHGNHQLVVVELAYKMPVVEIAEGVDQGLLMIGALHHPKESRQRVAELSIGHIARRLYINHRNQILLAGQALGGEVTQLLVQRRLGAEEVIGSYLQPVAMSQFDVALVARVDAVTALGGFQIDIGHLRMTTDGFPEHLTLIVAQVDAMYMTAGVLAHDIGIAILQVHDGPRPLGDRLPSRRFLGCPLLGRGFGGLLRRGLFLAFHHLGGLGALAPTVLLRALGVCISHGNGEDANQQKYDESLHYFPILTRKVTKKKNYKR